MLNVTEPSSPVTPMTIGPVAQFTWAILGSGCATEGRMSGVSEKSTATDTFGIGLLARSRITKVMSPRGSALPDASRPTRRTWLGIVEFQNGGKPACARAGARLAIARLAAKVVIQQSN